MSKFASLTLYKYRRGYITVAELDAYLKSGRLTKEEYDTIRDLVENDKPSPKNE